MAVQNYKVDRKQEVRKLNSAGDLETWYRIFATTAAGTVFHVEVSEKNLDNAAAVLSEKAAKLDSI